MTHNRIDSLDYLRGLLAAGVMCYHYYLWSGLAAPALAHAFLFKTGIYAVLAFYVISGISFGYVYRAMRIERGAMVEFWTKRFFRLAPLYWLAMAGFIARDFVLALRGGESYALSAWAVLANATLTFGVIDPGLYMVTGGWSIGNEMAYYVAFPVLLVALRHSARAYGAVLALSVAAAALFAFQLLSEARTLASQWDTYIHPLSHLYLFVAGVGISPLLARFGTLRPRAGYPLAMALVAVFAALPMGRDTSSIVTDLGWLVFSAVVVALCTVVYLTPMHFPGVVHRPLAWLGQASYSVYLLHALAFSAASIGLRAAGVRAGWIAVLVAVPLTFVVSHAAYTWVEVPMIAVGRRCAARWSQRVRAATPGADAAPAL